MIIIIIIQIVIILCLVVISTTTNNNHDNNNNNNNNNNSMAVMMSGQSMTQPKSSARSEMPAVREPMPQREQRKHAQPPARHVGGHAENRT